MLAAMLVLASHVLVTPPTGTTPPDDPPLRVWLNQDGNYAYPDRAKVYVKAADSGYLVVLRADADGRVRVLFPLDPGDNQRIDAGKKYELKGRGGREAFIADDTAGHGTVLAALSASPFQVDRFARDGHWDPGALSASRDQVDDAESVLRGLVEQMKPSGEKFAYAVATYLVSERYARGQYVSPFDVRWGYDLWGGPGVGLGYGAGLGYGYWGLSWYGPWYR
jgi:hypothetical protein